MTEPLNEIVALVKADNRCAADRIATMEQIGERLDDLLQSKYQHLCNAIDAVRHECKAKGVTVGVSKDYLKACYRLFFEIDQVQIETLKRKCVEVASIVNIMLSPNRQQLIADIGAGKIQPSKGKSKYGIGKGKKRYQGHIDHGVEMADGKNNPNNVVLAKPCGDPEKNVEMVSNIIARLITTYGRTIVDKAIEEARRRIK